MFRSFFKVQSRKLFRSILRCNSVQYQEDDLKRPAVVFSPHFDDETLGCGGTIIKKKRVGSLVKIVFMTDGSKSHRHLISEDKLKEIRRQEGLTVSRTLGLNESDVFLLNFEETKLSRYENNATDKVVEILLQVNPEEIFIPYYKEPSLWSEDHLATNKIVISALKMYKRPTTICEYPIWLWYSWPWTAMALRPYRKVMKFFKRSVFSDFHLIRDFKYCVYIRDVLDIKHAALQQYKSQMTRLTRSPHWRTLGDVSNGEFLECFFQEYEIFYRYGYIGK